MASTIIVRIQQISGRVSLTCDRAWKNYVRFLDRYGWKAQAINTCVLVGTGDVAAQLIIKNRYSLDTYDFSCSARYFGVGLCMLGPTMHVWYSALDKIVSGQTLRAAVAKMLMDQCMFLPIYVVAVIVVMGFLRLERFHDIREQIRNDYVSIMKTSYQIWPLLQIVNFYFVPLKHRILLMNMVGLVYNTYVAWKVEQKTPGSKLLNKQRPVTVPMKNR